MKHILITTIAAVLLVGCATTQSPELTIGDIISIQDAVINGNTEAVKQHLAAGVDVNAKRNGNTILHLATVGGHMEIAELLIANGADVNAKTGTIGTALSVAAATGYKEVVELLIAKGADVNVKGDSSGSTPSHRAAIGGHKAIAELLIAKGADVNVKNNFGDTPLDLAIHDKHTETADLLRKHGGKTSEELKAAGN